MSKRAVIYARFSSHSQTEQSIEGQLRECYDYAKRHELVVVNEYVDRALTGTTDKRPNFLQMIDDSKRKNFDYVLVYQLDRFARNRYDSATYKAKLKKNGIRVLSAKENISEDASGILIEGILESMAEYYSAELSQKVKRGIHESLLKGHYIGGSLLYGYDITDKRLQINPQESAVIRDIFERYKHGEKAKDIVDRLASSGIRNKYGRPFTINSLVRILRNSKYKGIAYINGNIYPDIFPPIIDEQTFAECNKILDFQRHRPKDIENHAPYLLSGKLFCGYCGTLMTAESGTSHTDKVYHYYKCFNRKKNKANCQKNNIRKQELEDIVFGETVKYVLQPDVIDKISHTVVDKFNASIKQNNALVLLEKEQAQIKTSINGILHAIEQGIITKTTKERLTELEQSYDELEEKITIQKSKQTKPLEFEKVKNFLLYYANKQYKTGEEKNEFFNAFIRRVVLFDERVCIFYNTSPSVKKETKLDKTTLNEINEFSANKNTQFDQRFKLDANGAEKRI